MSFKISCSFGEIVDKVTILRIKSEKATDPAALGNIYAELDAILGETPLANERDPLFDELQAINQQLWDLEDRIREKSQRKEFDRTYIDCAEAIHVTNDERYRVKRRINEQYKSVLKEEKVYK